MLKEFDLKPILCPICAAPIKPPFEHCEYCGTYFVASVPEKPTITDLKKEFKDYQVMVKALSNRSTNRSTFHVEKPPPEKPVRKNIPDSITRELFASPNISPLMSSEISRITHQIRATMGEYPSLIRRLAPAVFDVDPGWRKLQYPRVTRRENHIMPGSEIEIEKHSMEIPQIGVPIHVPRAEFFRMTAGRQRPPLIFSRVMQLFSAKEDDVGFKMLKENGTNIEGTFMDVMDHFNENTTLLRHPVDVVMDMKTYNEYRHDFLPYHDTKLNLLKERAGGEVFPLHVDENIVYFLPRTSGYDNTWCIYSTGIEITAWEKSWDVNINMKESFTVPVLRPEGVVYTTTPEYTNDLLGL